MKPPQPRAYRIRDYDEFIAVIDRIRVDRDMSYRTLAVGAGTSNSHVGRWLRGDVVALGPALWALAGQFGYDIALIPRKPEGDA